MFVMVTGRVATALHSIPLISRYTGSVMDTDSLLTFSGGTPYRRGYFEKHRLYLAFLSVLTVSQVQITTAKVQITA